jgi:hypothetical protein
MAYLRVPNADKAVEQFKKGLAEHPTPDQLNLVAYTLADTNLRLQEALDYSQRAVSDLSGEAANLSAQDAQPSNFILMRRLGTNWDTLGWTYFRLGNLALAEKYLEAAWLLVQQQDVGEHLVEVYEKLGKKQKAASICNMALAATLGDSKSHDNLTSEMTRLRPFLRPVGGVSGTTRPPDGAVALSDMRLFSVPVRIKLREKSGSATFDVALSKDGHIFDVAFVSGTEELRNAIAALSILKIPQSFPDDTNAKILRRATLNCSVYSNDCTLVLMPISEAAAAASYVPIPAN